MEELSTAWTKSDHFPPLSDAAGADVIYSEQICTVRLVSGMGGRGKQSELVPVTNRERGLD